MSVSECVRVSVSGFRSLAHALAPLSRPRLPVDQRHGVAHSLPPSQPRRPAEGTRHVARLCVRGVPWYGRRTGRSSWVGHAGCDSDGWGRHSRSLPCPQFFNRSLTFQSSVNKKSLTSQSSAGRLRRAHRPTVPCHDVRPGPASPSLPHFSYLSLLCLFIKYLA